ncbi:MAG: hypothetical protein HYU28_12300 [Actinobacteria bacterium]|nr:hypothetical protein [Actinomycetota bacterium]
MHRALVGVLVVANLAGATYLVIDRVDEAAVAVDAVSTSTTSTSPTTTSSTTTTSTTTTTTLPPTTTTGAPVVVPASGRAGSFAGFGAWVDVFDFSPGYMQEGETTPVVTPETLDAMALAGVTTLYIQASRDDPRTVGDLEQPETLARFMTKAHALGMRVVAWYLPKNYDDADLRRLRAIRDFRADGQGFDAIGVDIEFRGNVSDVAERNRRLVDLSRRFREESGEYPISAIVLPPVVTDIVNPNFWPSFPWAEIAPYYDAWLPMAYWTNRKPGTEWRDAHRYTEANVSMVRSHLGNPAAPVHVIGGIGDAATVDDYVGFMAAMRETGSIGWSVYDWRTIAPEALATLRG